MLMDFDRKLHFSAQNCFMEKSRICSKIKELQKRFDFIFSHFHPFLILIALGLGDPFPQKYVLNFIPKSFITLTTALVWINFLNHVSHFLFPTSRTESANLSRWKKPHRRRNPFLGKARAWPGSEGPELLPRGWGEVGAKCWTDPGRFFQDTDSPT